MYIYTTDEQEEFIPTWLMIKQHNQTGLLYFCKTSKKDPNKYLGSGDYWLKHIKKHGSQYVENIWSWRFENKIELVEFALRFSDENNIVKSRKWANMKPENGLDGGIPGSKRQQSSIDKANETRIKNGTNVVTKECIVKRLATKRKNGTLNTSTPERIAKQIETKKKNGTLNSNTPESIAKGLETSKRNNSGNFKNNNPTFNKKKCLHCDKLVGLGMYSKHHGDNCKIVNPNKIVSNSHLRENVEILRNLLKSHKIKLKQNWSRRKDEWINDKIKELNLKFSDIPLQT